MSDRLHLCDVSKNDERLSVFVVAGKTTHFEVELWIKEGDNEYRQQTLSENIPGSLRGLAYETRQYIKDLYFFLADFGSTAHENSRAEIREGRDFVAACNTTANLIEAIEEGRTLQSFIDEHCKDPYTPQITRPTQEQEEDHEIPR